MLIAHANGYPVTLKTNRGPHFVAFESPEHGLVYLEWQQAPCTLGTLDQILALNPQAFPKDFIVLYLPSRQTIELLVSNPEHFPTDEHLVTVRRAVPPATDLPRSSKAAAPDKNQGELSF
jgi:hypothetical protein